MDSLRCAKILMSKKKKKKGKTKKGLRSKSARKILTILRSSWTKNIVIGLITASIPIIYIIYNEHKNYNLDVDNLKLKANEAESKYKQGLYKEALELCELVYKSLKPNKEPVIYGKLKNIEGVCYFCMAQKSEQENHLTKSINAHHSALAFINATNSPFYYAANCNNLGNSYSSLATIKLVSEHADSALKYYNKTLEIASPQRYKDIYYRTRGNIGIIKSIQAGYIENLGEKHDAIKESIHLMNEGIKNIIDKNGIDMAGFYVNLGNAYGDLIEFENKEEFYYKSIAYFDSALIFYKLEEYPFDYSKIKSNLGIVFLDLAEFKDSLKYVNIAMDHIKEMYNACRSTKLMKLCSDADNHMGNAHVKIAEISDIKKIKLNNYHKANEYFYKALENREITEYPLAYAQTCNNLADSYFELFQIDSNYNMLDSAIVYFENTLNIYSLNNIYRVGYSYSKIMLGNCYRNKSTRCSTEVYLNYSIDCFKEALKVDTDINNIKDYGHINYLLANVYGELYNHTNDNQLIYLALECYNNSLKYYTADKSTIYNRQIMRLIKNTQQKLSK